MTARVAYLVGTPRSGSTLVSSLLGEQPGWFAAGEIRLMWRELATRHCGCGELATACPVWSRVIDRVGDEHGDPHAIAELMDATTAMQALPRIRRAASLAELPTATRAYADVLRTTYRALTDVTGADVVVDTSKAVAEARLLGLVDGVRSTVVHTVRDPRAVTHSWRRAVAKGAIGTPDRPVWSIALRWVLTNAASEYTIADARDEAVRIRYEDLTVDPAPHVAAVRRAVGAPPRSEATPHLRGHIVAGNSLRRASGPVEVRPDTRWRDDLPAGHARQVEVLTLPLRGRYDYRTSADVDPVPSEETSMTRPTATTSTTGPTGPHVRTSDGRRVANLVIAGAGKSGTSSMFAYLSAHPDILGSRVKETHFFDPVLHGEPLPPLTEYADFWPEDHGQRYLLEATPLYCLGGGAMARALTEHLGDDLRVVIMVRDPVERLEDGFAYMKAKGEQADLPDFAAYVDRALAMRAEGRDQLPETGLLSWARSFYGDYLPAWQEHLGDRLRLVWFDDLAADTPATVRSVFEWLDLDVVAADGIDFAIHNPTTTARSRTVQRVAVTAHRLGGRFLAERPALKARLRNLYLTVNGADRGDQAGPSDEIRARLDAAFADSNRRLAAAARAAGHERLPAWLAAAEQGARVAA